MELIIYTDGSAIGTNGEGPGGIGIVIIGKGIRYEISEGYKLTTNNRMELMAAIVALDSVPKGSIVKLHTDSQYLIKGMTSWINNWKKNGWKSSGGGFVKNKDLWVKLEEAAFNLIIEYIYVPAHTGIIENERADTLAKMGSYNPTALDKDYWKQE